MADCLSIESACVIFQAAVIHDQKELRKRALTFIEENTEAVFNSEESFAWFLYYFVTVKNGNTPKAIQRFDRYGTGSVAKVRSVATWRDRNSGKSKKVGQN